MSRKKKRLLENIFNIISILFIIGCFVFYGYRLIKYYKIFNPKETELNGGLLSISIPKNSSIVTSGNGLYHIGGSYIYKGNVDNNYITFSGLTFRILKMNYGSTVELVLDEPIVSLAWNDTLVNYDKSELNRYLNEEFIKYLNKDLLTTSNVCLDAMNEIGSKECENKLENVYVKTLDINTYLNTINETSYINEQDDYIWLSDRNETMAWHINGYNISTSFPNNYYGVLPVITLDMDVELISGTGTKDDPYRIDAKKEYALGSYVELDKDIWRIIETNEKTITISLDGELDKLMAFGSNSSFDPNAQGSLAYYLNNDYYDSLTYKNIIIESNYSQTNYSKNTEKFAAFVSIPTITTPKFGDSENQYYLLNSFDENTMFVYSNNLSTCKNSLAKSIKPVITIAKDSLKNGDGTKENPYITEEL